MGIKINALPAKTDRVSDNDLLVIEDSQDTKKITVKEARSALAVMSDEKLEIIKEDINNHVNEQISEHKGDVVNLRNSYYSLARNYEYLNSSFNDVKEKLYELMNKTNLQPTDPNTPSLSLKIKVFK